MHFENIDQYYQAGQESETEYRTGRVPRFGEGRPPRLNSRGSSPATAAQAYQFEASNHKVAPRESSQSHEYQGYQGHIRDESNSSLSQLSHPLQVGSGQADGSFEKGKNLTA